MSWVRVLLMLTIAAIVRADWWNTEVFYQIYPRSFQDSDGDGIGDLRGIQSRLGYLNETGITAVWLSPIFKSPMIDFGYDISDYRSVNSEYGTIQDLEELIRQAALLGSESSYNLSFNDEIASNIKIILDFVPNHTSDEHEWFKLSSSKTPGYEDYYVWNDGKVNSTGHKIPPNNWLSQFGGPAWTYHEGRQQWYLHQFGVKQPDLNYRNAKVIQEMKRLQYEDKGVLRVADYGSGVKKIEKKMADTKWLFIKITFIDKANYYSLSPQNVYPGIFRVAYYESKVSYYSPEMYQNVYWDVLEVADYKYEIKNMVATI